MTKLCVDCKNIYRSPFQLFTGFSEPSDKEIGCKAFVLTNSLVTGHKTYALAVSARADESMCGTEAKCFEEKLKAPAPEEYRPPQPDSADQLHKSGEALAQLDRNSKKSFWSRLWQR